MISTTIDTTSIVPNFTITRGLASMEFDADDALALLEALTGIVPKLAAHAPELIIDSTRVGDVLRCPHCATLIDPDDEPDALVEHDAAIRHNDAGAFYPDGDPDAGASIAVNQGQTEHATMAFTCAACDRIVSLPADIDTTWS